MTNTPRTPNPDEVICPNCVHQFRAVPENVQAELTAAQTRIADLQDAYKQANARAEALTRDVKSLDAALLQATSDVCAAQQKAEQAERRADEAENALCGLYRAGQKQGWDESYPDLMESARFVIDGEALDRARKL